MQPAISVSAMDLPFFLEDDRKVPGPEPNMSRVRTTQRAFPLSPSRLGSVSGRLLEYSEDLRGPGVDCDSEFYMIHFY